jgi:phage baseplate assembly protein V
MDELMRAFNRFLQPLRRRVLLMIGRGIIRLVNDAHGMQRIQMDGLAGEVLDDVERMQEYGFTSVPLNGAVAVFVALAGERANSLVIAVDDRRYRLSGLNAGEVALYDDLGQSVHLKRNGISLFSGENIILKTDGVLRLEGDQVEIHGVTSLQTDVHGKGSKESWQGGTAWHSDTYSDTHTSTSTEHGLDMPDIPSAHPETS